MKKILVLLLIVLSFSIIHAQDSNSSYVIFFYSEGCHACSLAEPVLNELESDYNIVIDMRELHESGNSELFQAYLDLYDVPINKWGYTPTTFVNDFYIIGYTSDYENRIIEGMNNCSSNGCVCPFNQTLADYYNAPSFPEVNNTINYEGNSTNTSGFSLTLAAVASAGLIDSINPCAFAVMIFLLTYLINVKNKKSVLKIGFAYVLSVFITYLLAGLGLLLFVQSVQVSSFIYYTAAFIALLAGLVNVKDFFFYNKGFSLRIPKRFKPIISKWSKKASIPAAIVLGFLVSTFELPCTGGVYLAILGILSKDLVNVKAMSYLIFYNFIFVLPLIFLIFLVYYGFSAKKLEEWRKSKRSYMKLASGIFMILLSVLMLKGMF